MPETTNIMTLKLTSNNKVKRSPPRLNVLANKKEIVLRGDPANASDVVVTGLTKSTHDGKTLKVALEDVFVVKKAGAGGRDEPSLPLKVGKGQDVRLQIRQDLPIQKRGTFAEDHDEKFCRMIDLEFNVERDDRGDHADWHIEC